MDTEIKAITQSVSALELVIRRREMRELQCVSADRDIDEGITFRARHHPTRFRRRIGPVAHVQGRCGGLLGHAHSLDAQTPSSQCNQQRHACRLIGEEDVSCAR